VEKAKEEAVEEQGGWRPEEIALLTKGITRWPPGATQRWKTIAEYVGSRSQKEVIKKSQELVDRKNAEMEEKREQKIAAAAPTKTPLN